MAMLSFTCSGSTEMQLVEVQAVGAFESTLMIISLALGQKLKFNFFLFGFFSWSNLEH